MTSEKQFPIVNYHFKMWLKSVGKASVTETLKCISKSLAAKGVPKEKIPEALVQISQSICLVRLNKLSDKEIKRHTRRSKKKKYTANNKIKITVNRERDGRKERTKDKTERITKKFQELFGDDLSSDETKECINNDEKWNKMGLFSPSQRSKHILNDRRNNEDTLPLEDLCKGPLSTPSSTKHTFHNGRVEDALSLVDLSKDMVSPRSNDILNNNTVEDAPLEESTKCQISHAQKSDHILNYKNLEDPISLEMSPETKIGSIRVKSHESLMIPDIQRNQINETKSSQNIPSLFFEEYRNHFNDQVEVNVLKLGELLWLAVSDNIQKKDRIERARQLSSNDLVDEEMKRAEQNFSTHILIRGNEFAPLFLEIFDKFDDSNRRTLFIALFCKILHHAMSFNADISPPIGIGEDTSCIKLARDVTSLMISNFLKNEKDIFHALDFDSTKDFESHVKKMYQVIFPDDQPSLSPAASHTVPDKLNIQNINNIHTQPPLAAKNVSIPGTPCLAQPIVYPQHIRNAQQSQPTTSALQTGFNPHFNIPNVTAQPLSTPYLNGNPKQHPILMSYLAQPSPNNSRQNQSLPTTISTRPITTTQQIITKATSQPPYLPQSSAAKQTASMRSTPYTIRGYQVANLQHIKSVSQTAGGSVSMPSAALPAQDSSDKNQQANSKQNQFPPQMIGIILNNRNYDGPRKSQRATSLIRIPKTNQGSFPWSESEDWNYH